MILKPEDVADIQARYHYLVNYESDDPNTQIDPLSYRDAGGDNLILIAAQLGDMDTVELLVGAGMNIDQQGEMGFTALHYAHKRKHAEMVDFLLARGASKNIENDFGKLPGDYPT